MPAQFPVGNFAVVVNNSGSNGLSGALNLSTSNGTNSATFKGQNDSTSLTWTTNASNQGVIGWTYTDNQGATHQFQGGVYTPGSPNYNKGSFSGGTVNADATVAGGSNESWDASASGPGEDEPLADNTYASRTQSK